MNRTVVAGCLAGCVLLLLGSFGSPLASLAAPPSDIAARTPVPSGLFEGHVRDLLTGQPVSGAFLHLRNSSQGVFTDSVGHYVLAVPPGTWELVVEAGGYISMSQTQAKVLAGRIARVDFDLALSHPDPEQEEALFQLIVQPSEQDGADEDMVSDVSAASVPATIRVLMTDGSVVEMDMDEYLKGVVPKEIGIWADMDALKAQAIAARSYAATSWSHGDKGAAICTTTHCQVWGPQHYATTDQAVDETSGMIAAYNGSIIRAFYFGHCDGHTRNSEDVWVSTVPYLRSVECVCGYDTMYGHGVGMCQRGAIEMARQGASFDEIIRHYYTGTYIPGLQPTPTPEPSVTPTPTPSPIMTMNYSLAKGWNLISLPMEIDDTAVGSVFAPISGKYDLVMQYDAFEPVARWKVFNAIVPVDSGLENLDPRYGIWIRTSQACSLIISGRRRVTSTSVSLNMGLNLVGYPSAQSRTLTDALSSITSHYVRVYTYDASIPTSPWQAFDYAVPRLTNTLKEMRPGMAYWVQVVQPCEWQVQP